MAKSDPVKITLKIIDIILKDGTGWKEGKFKFLKHVADEVSKDPDLHLIQEGVSNHIRTLKAVQDPEKEPCPRHSELFKRLMALDAENKNNFRNKLDSALYIYELMSAIRTSIDILNIIIKDGPMWEKSKQKFQKYISEKVPKSYSDEYLGYDSFRRYIQTFRAVQDPKNKKPAVVHSNGEGSLFKKLRRLYRKDRTFRRLLNNALAIYDK